ncbi:hypothetical protein ACOSP7_030370 [Xanthoceras sorbifolium]
MGMAFFSGIFSCFAESPGTSKQYVCNGDVCVLNNNQKKLGGKGSKSKQKTTRSGLRFPAFRSSGEAA